MRYLAVALLLAGSCPGPPPKPQPPAQCECHIPDATDPNWVGVQLPADETPWNVALFEQARVDIGSVCDPDPTFGQRKFVEYLTKKGICAAVWADAVLVPTPAGRWEELHVTRYVDGCWSSSATVVKGYWVHANAVGCMR